MTMNMIAAARQRAYELPIDQIDVSDIELFRDDTIWPYFERLRKEDPIHYCADSKYGPFWSITKYKDIMSVDTNHQAFSSADGITIQIRSGGLPTPGFIAMDPPRHDEQRKTVSPIVAPANLANLESTIRTRVSTILDSLPIGETFNWVDKVSIELTTQMLATLFDFPFEDRHLLTYWSDVATTDINAGGPIDSNEKKMAVLGECLAYFTKLWNRAGQRRAGQRPYFDAGAFAFDPQHGAEGIPRKSYSADRRRQRHHAQFDFGRSLVSQSESRSVPEAA